jgi:hypothetical protein
MGHPGKYEDLLRNLEKEGIAKGTERQTKKILLITVKRLWRGKRNGRVSVFKMRNYRLCQQQLIKKNFGPMV